MGYHTLVEISHDDIPRNVADPADWARRFFIALGPGADEYLPTGVKKLRQRHSSEPCSVRDRPRVSNEQIRVVGGTISRLRREVRLTGISSPAMDARIAGLEGILCLLRLLQKTDIHPPPEPPELDDAG